jgi:hypothetical protein
MPLRKAKNKSKSEINKAVAYNIQELSHNGTKERSRAQIIAIAESAARRGKSKKKKK